MSRIVILKSSFNLFSDFFHFLRLLSLKYHVKVIMNIEHIRNVTEMLLSTVWVPFPVFTSKR
jgi:hypothetical protein